MHVGDLGEPPGVARSLAPAAPPCQAPGHTEGRGLFLSCTVLVAKCPGSGTAAASVPPKAKLCPPAERHGAVLHVHGGLHSERGTSRRALATGCSSTGTAHTYSCFWGLCSVSAIPLGEACTGQASDAKNVKKKKRIKTRGSKMALVKMPPPLSPWIYLGDVRLLAAADKTPPSTRETQSLPERVARSKSRAVCSPAALSR